MTIERDSCLEQKAKALAESNLPQWVWDSAWEVSSGKEETFVQVLRSNVRLYGWDPRTEALLWLAVAEFAR